MAWGDSGPFCPAPVHGTDASEISTWNSAEPLRWVSESPGAGILQAVTSDLLRPVVRSVQSVLKQMLSISKDAAAGARGPALRLSPASPRLLAARSKSEPEGKATLG